MLEESMSIVPSASIWTSIFSWCTPAVLFVVINFTIVTIYVTSGFGAANKHSNSEKQKQLGSPSPNRFARSPSFLERLQSTSFYNYRSQEPISGNLESESHLSQFSSPEPRQGGFLSRSPSILQRLKSINLYESFSPKIAEPEAHFPSEQKQPEKAEEKEEIEIEEQGETLGEIRSKASEITRVARTKSDTVPASGEIPAKLPQKLRKSASTKSAFAHFEEDDIVERQRPATTRESKAKTSDEDEEVDAKADDFINKFKHQLKLQRMDSIIRYKEMVHRGSEK